MWLDSRWYRRGAGVFVAAGIGALLLAGCGTETVSPTLADVPSETALAAPGADGLTLVDGTLAGMWAQGPMHWPGLNEEAERARPIAIPREAIERNVTLIDTGAVIRIESDDANVVAWIQSRANADHGWFAGAHHGWANRNVPRLGFAAQEIEVVATDTDHGVQIVLTGTTPEAIDWIQAHATRHVEHWSDEAIDPHTEEDDSHGGMMGPHMGAGGRRAGRFRGN